MKRFGFVVRDKSGGIRIEVDARDQADAEGLASLYAQRFVSASATVKLREEIAA